MDRSLARFAGWVVARQLAFLLVGAAVVLLMAWWIFTRSRAMAVEEAGRRQMMLAEQTARGIETYYQSIVETLDLIRRSSVDTDPASAAHTAPPAAGGAISRQLLMPIFWEQLRDRASHFFVLDQQAMRVLTRFSEDGAHDLEEIIEARGAWLAGVDKPNVGKAGEFRGRFGSMVCVPLYDSRRLLCAVVPIQKVERRFLANITRDGRSGAMLLDETGRVMSFNDIALIGKSMLTEVSDPFLLEVFTRTLNGDSPTTTMVPRNSTRTSIAVEAGLVSVQPVNVADGRWWLAISSPLNDIEQVVQVMFRRIAAFAAVAIGCFTFAFSRIAISQIRGRAREERVRSNMLRREVEEARRIQLAWLPSTDAAVRDIDIRGINKAANHISGDFYNWFELPDGRVCVLIGDVTGHGMSAAFLMSTTQMLLRAVMLRVQDPGQSLSIVNKELSQHSVSGQFVTILMLAINRESGEVQLATAGHPPPVVLRGDGVQLLAVVPQLVAGIDTDWVYPTETVQLPGTTSLLLYTDGIPDAPAEDGSRLGDDGLLGAVQQPCQSANDLIEQVLDKVEQFRGKRDLSDDVTMVAIRFSTGPATFAASAVETD